MAVNKVNFGGNTLIDLTGDTLESAEQLLKGIIAHCKDGTPIEGTLEAGGGIPGYQIVSGTYSPSEDITSTIYVYRTKKLGIYGTSVSDINKRCVAITFLDISLTDEIIYPTAGYNAFALGKGLNYNYSSSSLGATKLISNALGYHKMGTNSYGMEVILACNSSYPLKAGNTYRWVLLAPDDISIESI